MSTVANGESGRIKLTASAEKVNFGDRFALGGEVPGRGGSALRVQFRTAGTHGWSLVKKAHTDKKGRYGIRTHAHVSGEYRAVPKNGRASATESVRVRSATSFHLRSHNIVLGNSVGLKGAIKPGGKRDVKIVAKGAGKGVVTDSTSANGKFGAKFTPDHTGVYNLRAFAGSNELGAGGRGPARKVTVYRYAVASWYGGSLYGNGVACGGTLTPTPWALRTRRCRAARRCTCATRAARSPFP